MATKEQSEFFLEMVDQRVQQLVTQYHRPATEIVLDDVDLRNMLKISRRTALNYRQLLGLRFYKVENKIYYFLSDVLEFIKKQKQ